MQLMLNYPAIEALDAVIQTGSFEKAADVLKISASAVSQRITKLEHQVSSRLVVRGKPCVATDEGTLLLQHLGRVRLLEDELTKWVPEISKIT